MRFTEYKGSLTQKAKGMKKLEAEIREFMKMNVKAAKVTFTRVEYKNCNSCAEGLRRVAKAHALPVTVVTRKGEVFIINNEID